MKTRMTWSEIQKAYPKQFVYLSDVERGGSNGTDIISAIVSFQSDERDDGYDSRTYNGEFVRRYTAPGETLPLGALMV